VKAGLQGDEFVPAGVKPGQLHGTFDGFGAAVAKECPAQPAGGDVSNLSARSATACTW
jgi:hypothetical protein